MLFNSIQIKYQTKTKNFLKEVPNKQIVSLNTRGNEWLLNSKSHSVFIEIHTKGKRDKSFKGKRDEY